MTQRSHSSFHSIRRACRRPLSALATLLFAALLILPLTGRAQLLGSLTEGPASSPYTYYLTVQFGNGHYYDYTLRSTVASYTGYDFLNTVATGSQGTAFVLTVAQVGPSSFGYYVNGMTVNGDMNNGFVNNSYWSYWTGSATTPVAWTSSDDGESGRIITPGQADGWVYGDGTLAPSATTFPVPEPSAWTLAALGLAAGGAWGVRRRGQALAAR